MKSLKTLKSTQSIRIPFGKKLSNDGKTLVDNESEMLVIAVIHELRDYGLSLEEIIKELQKFGYVRKQY